SSTHLGDFRKKVERIAHPPSGGAHAPDGTGLETHGGGDLLQGAVGDLVGALVALGEDAAQVGAVGRELGAAGADRAQELVDRVDDDLLERGRSAVPDLGGDVVRVAVLAQGGQQHQVRDAGTVLGVVGDVPVGV